MRNASSLGLSSGEARARARTACTSSGRSLFHEVLEPRIVDVRADALSAAQLTLRRLAPEPLQHDSHLLFGSELPSRRPSHLPHELTSFVGPGLRRHLG